MPDPLKGFGALRKGRHSSPGADYFLTLCLQRPAAALNDSDVHQRCRLELSRLENERNWTLRCAVIMPDHLHLLVSLGPIIDLSSVVRLFKGRMTPLLRQHQAAWQQSSELSGIKPDLQKQQTTRTKPAVGDEPDGAKPHTCRSGFTPDITPAIRLNL